MDDWVSHHATGSDADGYLDPDLSVSIPLAAHDEIHGLWRAVGIDRTDALLAGPRAVAGVELRLRRLAPTLEVVAGLLTAAACVAGASPIIVVAVGAFLFVLAVQVERWANELADHLLKGLVCE
jgi:hypothetical protein